MRQISQRELLNDETTCNDQRNDSTRPKIYRSILQHEPDLICVINRENISKKKKTKKKKKEICDKIATTEYYRTVLLQTLG